MFTLQIILEIFAILLIALGYYYETELIQIEYVLTWYIKKQVKGLLK